VADGLKRSLNGEDRFGAELILEKKTRWTQTLDELQEHQSRQEKND
jgi:hypothetical protein